MLDERLQHSIQLGHDYRWKAVFEVARSQPDVNESDMLLAASLQKFVPGGLGEAYAIRNSGIVSWLTRCRADARKSLKDAEERFSEFADPHALALNFFIRRRLVSQSSFSDRRLAMRLALAAVALHPYGAMLDGWKRCRADFTRMFSALLMTC